MAKSDKVTGLGGATVTKPGKAAASGLMSSAAATPAPRARSASGTATPRPSRQAVVVLAMHRTGSSALSRMLNLAGCDLPRTLMGGDASNQTGHWESTVIRALDDDILASGGSNWQDWTAFNPQWYQTARPREFMPRGLQVLQDEYGATGLMVIKDPRMCRIFPFWRDLLAQADIAPSVLLPLRHPAEVAASLNGRNALPEVHGALLWLRHVLDAEHASRGLPRAVVLYDRLLARPAETLRGLQEPLGLIWPRLSEMVSAEIGSFVSPELRHHKADPQAMSALAFRDWLSQTYAIFERWSETAETPADHATLDGIRAALDRLATPLSTVVATLTRQSTEIAAMDKDIRYLRFEAGKRGDALTALTAEKDALITSHRAEQQALQGRLSETTSALRQRQLEAEQTATALAEAKKDLERAMTELDTMRAAQAEQKKREDALIEAQNALRQRHHEAEGRAAALTANLLKQEAAETARYDEIADLTQALLEREAVIAANVAVIERAIDATLKQARRPWLIGPLRVARQAALLTASGLFDADFYRQTNPDVAESGMNPARHFIRFGRAEGRHPLPDIAHNGRPGKAGQPH